MAEYSGKLEFELVEGWEKIPDGYMHRDVVGVGVDSKDRVYLLARNDDRVMVYEPDGTFITHFAEGAFTGRTHGVRIGPDDAVYCVDDRDHSVRKFSPDGRLLMTIGTPGVPSDTGLTPEIAAQQLHVRLLSIHSGPPFNRPTGIAIAPDGELYVADGYANARIHRFTADGELIQSWGEPGTGPGQFNLPHDVWITRDNRVLVVDRENDRIQIFNRDGEYQDQWTHVQRPTGIYEDQDGLIYISELSRRAGTYAFPLQGPVTEDQPGRASILAPDGTLLHRWGNLDRCAPGQFCAPHCICVDSHGDIYVGEVTYTDWGSKGFVPPDCHMFQKFARKR